MFENVSNFFKKVFKKEMQKESDSESSKMRKRKTYI